MNGKQGEFAAGWRVLFGCALGVAIGVSSLYFYSLGLFMIPLTKQFGWTRAQASLGPLVGTACAAVMCVPIGRMVDRIGSFKVALASLALLAISFAALAMLTRGLISYLVITAILSLLTAGSSPVPFTRLVVASFEQHRGLALGIVLCATGGGGMLIPALLPTFIGRHGWQMGYLLLSGLIAALLPVLFWLLRHAKEPIMTASDPRPMMPILLSRTFRTFALVFFCASVAVFGTLVHFVPMLIDAGFTLPRAGQIAALIGIAAMIGRLSVGWLLDRNAPEQVAAVLFTLVGVGLGLLAWGGIALAVPGAIIIGLAMGAEVDLMAFFTSRYFERDDYGRCYGALYTLFLVGGALGPMLAGFVFDRFGYYRPWLIAAAVLLLLAAFVIFSLDRRSGLRPGTSPH